ncbi:hypothetical protein VE01_09962 [Pseudogymnoascus verrucosus]|uniref:Putative transcription factor kapC n=1 Tax=Pseudogymnoascus verrucosus TaxID=342668 RepID=A0A1B8G818_9PEZI|nr:uncharacterized protein VE01_09962 [Pseudogymnoascus verrucosus]OBT91978.1 hypothetical protein VE01_09962 [Pseudogymnoascus verrucosus]
MTAKYDSDFTNIQSYLKPADISGGMFHGTSSEFSTVSPSHATGFDNMYGNHVSTLLRNAYPVQYPVTAVAMGFDVEGLYETQVCRRKKSTGDKLFPPYVNLRRRAQNRASQRKFRARKAERMKEIEEGLMELQEQHSALTLSYQTLQVEYATAKQELATLRTKHTSEFPESTYSGSGIREWEGCQTRTSDPLPFDVSTFSYRHEQDEK